MNSSVDEIKNRLDVVDVVGSYLKLQKAGINFRALCPFHSEKSPSFFVSPSRQLWRCFGCGAGGDMFQFVMDMEGIEFRDALQLLAKKAGVEVVFSKENKQERTERAILSEICELACQFFETQLRHSTPGKEALAYLKGRGVSEDSLTAWRLGYAPNMWHGLSDFLIKKGYHRKDIVKAGLAIPKESNPAESYDRFRGRIMFPVHDHQGQIVGFGGRILEGVKDEAKYMNTPSTLLYDKSRVLYGLDKAKVAIRKSDRCILTEGYMDVILSHQAGVENVVAVSGTALTQYHLRVLKRYTENLTTAFDMDTGGDSATKRGIQLAQTQGFAIQVIVMPEGKDPADLVQTDAKKWQELIDKGVSVMEYFFQSSFAVHDVRTQEGRKQITQNLLPLLKQIPDRIEQSRWVQELANRLGVKEEDVREEMKKVKLQEETYGLEPEEVAVKKPMSRRELIEERALVLFSRMPNLIGDMSDDILSSFSPNAQHILKFLREGKDMEEVRSMIDETSHEFYNYYTGILMRAEVEQGEEHEAHEELESLVRELVRITVREKLDSLSREIKLAESEHDGEALERLLQEFQHYSHTLSHTESQTLFSK